MNRRHIVRLSFRSGLRLVAVALLLSHVTLALAAANYDLAREFSPTSNPNDVWSFGWQGALGGTVNLLTVRGTTRAQNGVPIDFWQAVPLNEPTVYHNGTTNTATSQGGQGVFPPGTVWYFAGPNGSGRNFGVIRFTAPTNAAFELYTTVDPYLNGPPQGDTDFHVAHNAVQIFGTNLPAGARAEYGEILTLNAGDTVDLAIGRGADDNNYASGLKITATLTLGATNPPSILTPPFDQTAQEGSTVTFSVAASGTRPLSYQWRFNDADISGATSSALTLPNVQFADAGNYSVVVANSFGSVTSAVAVLTVQAAPPPSIVRGPYLQLGTPSSMTVRWRTSRPTSSRVWFGPAQDSRLWIVEDSASTNEHLLTLTNLAADSKYFYAVGEGTNVLAGGADYSLTTAPTGSKPTRIWAVGDAGTASLGSSIPFAVRNAYSAFTGSRPTDVWLMLGDNAYLAGTDAEYQAAVFDVFQQYLRTTPVWPTIGNHETYAPLAGGRLAYEDIFSLPQAGEAGGVASGTERFYSFDYGNIHFVCLDSELSANAPGSPMLAWLDQDLAACTKDWIIAYWHSPPYSKGSHDSDFEANLVEMRENVVPVLESYGVDLVLCGHSHSYERSFLLNGHYGNSSSLLPSMITDAGSGRPEETGAYLKGAEQGAVYVVAGSSGQTSGGLLNHPAMFASLNRLGSVVIDVETNRLDAKFLRENGQVNDSFTLLKGTVPPTIISGPSSRTAVVGDPVVFSVLAQGSRPLNYQWRFNDADLPNALSASLSLPEVQLSQAGNYSVVVANAAGSVTSAVAVLTVTLAPVCVAAPDGLEAWWPGDGDAEDVIGSNPGALRNGADFGEGKVGQGFRFDGSNDDVLVADSPSLDLTNQFTIELWFRRDGPWVPNVQFVLFDKRDLSGRANYGASLSVNYGLILYYRDPQAGDFQIAAYPALPSTNAYHHFAGVFRQNDPSHVELKSYLDGQLVKSSVLPGNLNNTVTDTPLTIGSARGVSDFFKGILDEVSIYGRALGPEEIAAIHAAGAAGKCRVAQLPRITAQPQSRTATVGETVSFSVSASGTGPLSYQWRFNDGDIPNATQSSLTLSNVQLSQAGDYTVVVANAAGSVTSTVAVLTVHLPPSTVRLVSANAAGGGQASVPVQMLAQGNEAALGFSLNFDTALLALNSVTLGADTPAGVTLIVNDTQAAAGRVGLGVALPAGSAFAAGTQEIAVVRFTVAAPTNSAITPITFGDVPTARQLSDPQATGLPAIFEGGTVSISAVDFEGDVASRPDGDRALRITDWVQLGRFVAGLDTVSSPAEFQRADCAPRVTLGNGTISVTDYVQAGRYAIGLDPLTPAGGPTSEGAFGEGDGGFRPASSGRTLRLLNTSIAQGQTSFVPAILEASGNENALGFSVAFDPLKLGYVGVVNGAGAAGATLTVNASQESAGRLGIVIALPPGSALAAGRQELVLVQFLALAPASSTATVSFDDKPVARETSDSLANALHTTYTSGTISVTPPSGPPLRLTRSGNSLLISWPSSATGFELEATAGALGTAWSPVPGVIDLGEQKLAIVNVTGAERYFRLKKQ